MENKTIKIDDQFWFGCREHHSIKNLNEAVRLFSEDLESAKKLEGDWVIFLDTNVLTDYYKISTKERIKLKGLFKKYEHRIILTKKVEEEFLKNRIKIIRDYKTKLKGALLDGFKPIIKTIKNLEQGEINGVEGYLDSGIIKHDFTDIEADLKLITENIKRDLSKVLKKEDILSRITALEKKINKKFEEATRENDNHEKEDKYLALLSTLKVLDRLSQEETTFILKKYKELIDTYNVNKSILTPNSRPL